MNSLALQVTLAKRCFSLASRSSIRSFSSTRLQANEEEKSSNESQTIEDSSESNDSQPAETLPPNSVEAFFEKGIIGESVHKGLSVLGFKTFTPVQAQTIEPFSKTEKGIVARAKTGTGKTLAFGIPLIEKSLNRKDPTTNPDVIGLVISPTRDLAYQIRDEIVNVTKHFHPYVPNVNTFCLVGAEPKVPQIKAFTRFRTTPQIVVATPGRLLDMLQDPIIQDAFKNLEFKVLDEADRLLDDGFKESLLEIQDVIDGLKEKSGSPTEKTMLFSATIDRNVLSFAENLMGKNFTYIDTVDPNEPETHENINQSLITTDNLYESFVAAAKFIEEGAKTKDDFKAVVFLPTVKSVSYFQDCLFFFARHQDLNVPIFELHGKLTQSARDNAVKNFRKRSRGVLVTSDVGARGMDFPGVTNVVQVGVPTDTTNYVHRIGRTARGGKKGEALLILTQSEAPFIRLLHKRKIEISNQEAYEESPEVENLITEAYNGTRHRFSLLETIESFLGFYNGVMKGYRLDDHAVFGNISDSYGVFCGSPGTKPRVSKRLLTHALNIDQRTSHMFFDLSSDFGEGGRFGGEGATGDRFGGDRFGGDRFGGDRFGGNRSGDRGNSNNVDRFGGSRFGESSGRSTKGSFLKNNRWKRNDDRRGSGNSNSRGNRF